MDVELKIPCSIAYIFTHARMNPALHGSSVIQHFQHGNVIEIYNRIIFSFYMGLSHIDCLLLRIFNSTNEWLSTIVG